MLEQRWTDTCDFADVVLPATMQPEHLDLHSSYGHHYTTLNVPVADPPGEALPNTEIFRRIAAAMGLDHPRLRDSDEDLVRQLLDGHRHHVRGAARDDVRPADRRRARHRAVRRGRVPHPERPRPHRSTRSSRAAASTRSSATRRRSRPPTPSSPSAIPLVLVAPGRPLLHELDVRLAALARAQAGPAAACTCTPTTRRRAAWSTAARCGCTTTAARSWRPCEVDDATRPGLAFTYKAYWARLSPGRQNVNAVTAVRDTDLGGGPTFHDTRVEVEGVPAELLETPPPEVEELVAGD